LDLKRKNEPILTCKMSGEEYQKTSVRPTPVINKKNMLLRFCRERALDRERVFVFQVPGEKVSNCELT
jgi:hypothetical protein